MVYFKYRHKETCERRVNSECEQWHLLTQQTNPLSLATGVVAGLATTKKCFSTKGLNVHVSFTWLLLVTLSGPLKSVRASRRTLGTLGSSLDGPYWTKASTSRRGRKLKAYTGPAKTTRPIIELSSDSSFSEVDVEVNFDYDMEATFGHVKKVSLRLLVTLHLK